MAEFFKHLSLKQQWTCLIWGFVLLTLLILGLFYLLNILNKKIIVIESEKRKIKIQNEFDKKEAKKSDSEAELTESRFIEDRKEIKK